MVTPAQTYVNITCFNVGPSATGTNTWVNCIGFGAY